MANVPNTPAELGLDPNRFPSWRENQQEAIGEIADEFVEHDFVLAEFPTGAGKTPIGVASSRMQNPANPKSLTLAHTIALQEQQLQTIPTAITATGRRNHPCLLLGEPFNAEDANDLDQCGSCKYAAPKGCSYYRQWFAAQTAPDVMLNYAYIIRAGKAETIKVRSGTGTMGEKLNQLPNPFINRDLMVCDEGHNLENALVGQIGAELRLASFDRYNVPCPNSINFADWVVWAQDAWHKLNALFIDLQNKAKAHGARVDTIQEARRVKAMIRQVENVQDLYTPDADSAADTPPVFVGLTKDIATIQPLFVWHKAKKMLFNYGMKKMIMSATLGSPGLTARLLGLAEDEYTHIAVPSTFPVENRPIVMWPVSKMSYDADGHDRMLQAKALVYLAETFPNQPGVVHCHSFAWGDELAAMVRQISPRVASRLITHNSADRKIVHAAWEHNEGHGDAILITPSATTGVDWDFVGWQVLNKVPYAYLGDPVIRARTDYVTSDGEKLGQQVYTEDAVKTVVQSCGRNVRTPTSRGINIITDAAFSSLFNRASDAFPEWFKDAIRPMNNKPDLEEMYNG